MYIWRQLTPAQQKEILTFRILQQRPWHSPPTLFDEGLFHLSAACYKHMSHIGREASRIADFSRRLIQILDENDSTVFAWCVLPNHYHLLVDSRNLRRLKKEIGRLHGRTSRQWNLAEDAAGRTVWHNCADRGIRSERHFWATINYIHNNPVRHGYVSRWELWPYSSAREYLNAIGRERAKAIWREYPVLGYGRGWDEPEL